MTSIVNDLTNIRYMRYTPISFHSPHLRPDRILHFHFDDINVDDYCQNLSKILTIEPPGANFNINFNQNSNKEIICESSNAFARIVRGVEPNKYYIDDCFIRLNVTPYSVTPLNSSSFSPGDRIHQVKETFIPYTNISTMTQLFAGSVVHWFSSNSVLVIQPSYGNLSLEASSNTIFKYVGGTRQAVSNAVSVQVTTPFPAGATIKQANSAVQLTTRTIFNYSHNSGLVLANTGSTLNLSSSYNFTSQIPITIVAGSGAGQKANIISITGSSNNVATIDSTFINLSSNSRYSIGAPISDERGTYAGIFHVPENKFDAIRTGERTFSISDGSDASAIDATTYARAVYIGGALSETARVIGTLRAAETSSTTDTGGQVVVVPGSTSTNTGTNQPGTVTGTQTEEDGTGTPLITGGGSRFESYTQQNYNLGDPVAQTFFTPKRNTGLFITSVDLFFKNKPLASNEDAELPVTIKIVTTQNGYPTDRIVGWATVQCDNVKITDGANTIPNSSNTETQTKFTFPDPLFLNPGTEYAIIVHSDSPTYEVWTAELGETIIGDPNERRVSEQPYVGSFFRSQNASTWTPYQNEDLMFRINRASFNSADTVLIFGTEPLEFELPYDEIIINATELEFAKANIDHKIKTTLYSSMATEGSFRDIQPNKPFSFAQTTDSVSSTGRRRIIPAANTTGLQTQVILNSEDDYVAPFLNAETYNIIVSKNLINNGELYDNNITITNRGYHDNVANVRVTIGDSNLYANVAGANATAIVVLNASGNVTAINIVNAGKGYIESPTITIGEHGRTDNATAVIISEDSKYGGNALCRYITRKVTLTDGFDSGDLRVTVRGIRPQGTNILVYYKVQSASDSRSFSEIKWRRMHLENDFFSPDFKTAIDFKYKPSSDPRINRISYVEDNVTYPLGGTFKHFAIKIVMLAECGCAAPAVRNLRVIAMPEG